MNIIFNFHVVSDSDWFEKVILFLKSRFRMVSIEKIQEYMNGQLEEKNYCHITVDDGDISFYKNIFPVLKKHQIPATIYVSPKICLENKNFWFQEIKGYDRKILLSIFSEMSPFPNSLINDYSMETALKTQTFEKITKIIDTYQLRTKTKAKINQNMSVENLIEVNHSNIVTIGAHTMNHPILKNETDEDSKKEIFESITLLSELLNTKVKYFAYPNGLVDYDFSEREEKTLGDAGINLAFTTESKNFKKTDTKYRIPRIGISDLESLSLIKTKIALAPKWNYLKNMKPSSEYQQRKKLKMFALNS